MKENIKDFTLAIQDWAKNKAPKSVQLLQRRLVLELLTRVVLKTPVDTGRARNNWQVTFNQPATKQVPYKGIGKVGKLLRKKAGDPTEVLRKGYTQINQMPQFCIAYITNNVEYILYLEAGHSKQAPNGMAALAFQEVSTVFKTVPPEVKT